MSIDSVGRHGRWYYAECGLRNAESCQGVICRKSSAERSANYPLVAFPHSAAEKFRISADRKTTVRSHCTTDVQPMHTIPWSIQKWKKNEKWFIGYSSSMLDCTSNKTLKQEHTIQNYNTPVTHKFTIFSNLADLRLTMWSFSNRWHDLALI